MNRPTFDLDGRPVPFVPGQSVGAALVADGTLAWRTTRVEGRPRGIFCGIGICFDCLVAVDGQAGQRACLVLAEQGQDVRTRAEAPVRAQTSGGPPADAAPEPEGEGA